MSVMRRLPSHHLHFRQFQHHHHRFYSSSAPTPARPLIKTHDIPAPHIGSIRVLLLDRPAARNALSRQMVSELRHEIERVHAEHEASSTSINSKDNTQQPPPQTTTQPQTQIQRQTRALILASNVDASFCAGADLKERAGFTQEETASFLALLRHTFHRLSTLPIPTISALSSVAYGGGLELALATHLRVFHADATVALPETRLGIVPGAGGTYRLPGIVGLARAREMVLTGRKVGGREAWRIGLCDRLVGIDDPKEIPKEDPKTSEDNMRKEKRGSVDSIDEKTRARELVLQESIRLATEICEGAPMAIKAALKAVGGWQGGERVENAAYEEVVRTRDRDEALLAFRERRKPVFEGR